MKKNFPSGKTVLQTIMKQTLFDYFPITTQFAALHCQFSLFALFLSFQAHFPNFNKNTKHKKYCNVVLGLLLKTNESTNVVTA